MTWKQAVAMVEKQMEGCPPCSNDTLRWDGQKVKVVSEYRISDITPGDAAALAALVKTAQQRKADYAVYAARQEEHEAAAVEVLRAAGVLP